MLHIPGQSMAVNDRGHCLLWFKLKGQGHNRVSVSFYFFKVTSRCSESLRYEEWMGILSSPYAIAFQRV